MNVPLISHFISLSLSFCFSCAHKVITGFLLLWQSEDKKNWKGPMNRNLKYKKWSRTVEQKWWRSKSRQPKRNHNKICDMFTLAFEIITISKPYERWWSVTNELKWIKNMCFDCMELLETTWKADIRIRMFNEVKLDFFRCPHAYTYNQASVTRFYDIIYFMCVRFFLW